MKKINKGLKGHGLSHLTWKSYNSIKKKAMEQEFSWSGLTLSLSIAFFISIGSAQALNLTYQSVVNKAELKQEAKRVYQIELVENYNGQQTQLA